MKSFRPTPAVWWLVAVWLAAMAWHGWVAATAGQAGWVACALRNAQEHGFWLAGGKPVMNPGGVGLPSEPEVYWGYRGWVLWPIHCAHVLTGNLAAAYAIWAGFLLAVVIGGVWWGFGGDRWATLTAAAVGLSPALLRATTEWDPIPTTLWLGAPVLAAVARWAAENEAEENWWRIAGLIGAYAFGEWAAGLVILIAWTVLTVLWWRHKWRMWLAISAALALVGAISLGTLVAERAGDGLGGFVRGYGYGTAYAGATMTWSLALQRIATAGVLALAPILAVAGWMWWRGRQGRTTWVWLPLAAAALGVVALRNAMAHHQWIAASVLGLGLLGTLCCRRWRFESLSPPSWTHLTALGICFLAYAVMVGLLLRENSRAPQRLVSFVQAHTPRHATIILGPGCGAGFRSPGVVSYLLDRRCVTWHQATSGMEANSEAFWLDRQSEASDEPGTWVLPPTPRSWVRASLDWYRQRLVRHRAGTYLPAEAQFTLRRWPAEGP